MPYMPELKYLPLIDDHAFQKDFFYKLSNAILEQFMILYQIKRLYNLYIRKFYNFHHLGKGASIRPFCDISPDAAPYIYIGEKVRLHKDIWLNIHHGDKKAAPPIIKLEAGVAIGRRCTISGSNSIVIGKNVIFAPNVFITDHLHEYRDNTLPIKFQGITEPGSITIEEGCWLGYGCSIIASEGKHIQLGKNTIVGANCVVTKSFPDNSTLFGIPARNVAKAVNR